ncbi:MAG: hypothetical protein J0M18_20480 [Ignavibacteria bacterium]|nr:hypothetical protein [Ignavibacteria bacterium]
MKKIILLLLILITEISYSQTNEYKGYLEELYVARQPSPRAEAMGRGHVADNQNDFGSFYNPALTSLSEGLNINTSFSSKFFYSDSAFYNYFGASYKLKNIGSFSLSKYRFDYGQEFYVTTAFEPEGTGEKYRIYYDIYTLNYSREIIKDFYAGLNVNFVDNHNPDLASVPKTEKNLVTAFDIGLLKKFRFAASADNSVSHSVNAGLSVNNFTSSKFVFKSTEAGVTYTSDAYLPVIFRLGGSYYFIQMGNKLRKNGEQFSILAHLEYEKILNTAKYETYKAGAEFKLFDILALRLGWLSRNSHGTSSVFAYNTDEFTDLIYGAGVKIPVDLIFKINTPVSLMVDYVNLKHPQRFSNTGNVQPEFKRHSTLGISLNWVPGL